MAPTMICSVDTVRARLGKIAHRPDLIIWDECHHIKAEGWERIREWAGDRCKHIGLTATPQRLDGKGLNPPFTAMTLGPSTAELMAMGMLSRYRAFCSVEARPQRAFTRWPATTTSASWTRP